MRWGTFGRALAVVALVTGATGCNWLQNRYDAGHTGHNPSETTLSPANVGDLELAWSAAVGAGGGAGDPVVTAGGVFVSTRTQLRAFEADTGAPRWTVDRGTPIPERDPILTQPAATEGGAVLVGEQSFFGSGGASGAVLAYDAETGEPVHLPIHDVERPIQPDLGPPTVVGDEVYGPFGISFPLAGGRIAGQAGLLASGRTMLVNETPPNAPGLATVAGGVLYHVDAGGNLEAFDAAGETGCSPLSSPPNLYVCQPLWSAPVGAGGATPVAAGGLVLVAAGDQVTAFTAGPDAASATPLWSVSVPGASAPAVAGGTAYVGSSDGLVALDLAGCAAGSCAPAWTGATGGGAGTPTVANGVVYAAVAGGRLVAFDAAGCGAPTCPPLWDATTPAPVGSPVVTGGRLFARTTAGDLLAYALPAGGGS